MMVIFDLFNFLLLKKFNERLVVNGLDVVKIN